MKKSTLNKVGVVLSLLLFISNNSFSKSKKEEIKRNKNERYYREVVIDCSQYVMGNENPNQSISENVKGYLKVLDLSFSDSKLIYKEVFNEEYYKGFNKIPPNIEALQLNKKQGVVFCILYSKLAISHIIDEFRFH